MPFTFDTGAASARGAATYQNRLDREQRREMDQQAFEERKRASQGKRYFKKVSLAKQLSDSGDWTGLLKVSEDIGKISPEFAEGSATIANNLANMDFDAVQTSINQAYNQGTEMGVIKAKDPLDQEMKRLQISEKRAGLPLIQMKMDALLKKSKGSAPIGFKGRQGLNKDITSIMKGVNAIRSSAEELSALRGRGTAAAKLGAVFKFMKALDPTSVVRETEQGQVYSAAGAGAQLAGAINGLLGQGKLTDKGFDDLVKTSKVIANSNINSISNEVSTLLDSFEDTIPASFKKKLMNRVPKSFIFDNDGPAQTAPAPQPAKGGLSPELQAELEELERLEASGAFR